MSVNICTETDDSIVIFAFFHQEYLEELESTVVVVHVVHNLGTGVVHASLELLSVHLVVVAAWLAKYTLDELLVLIVEFVWSDDDGVD